MTNDPAAAATRAAAGLRRFEPAGEALPFEVDGASPSLYAEPCSADQLKSCMQSAAARNLALIPIGGGNLLDLGAPPQRYDLALRLHRLARIVDYQPADMTVTVEAGVRLGVLADLLAAHGQWLPLDPPAPERHTVGGVIAANLFGPCRVSQGRVRDLLLGIKVFLASGTAVKAGGRVVKNVAGYDLAKLYVGSLGSLGILVEATMKVRPAPDVVRHYLVGADDLSGCTALGLRLADDHLCPFALASHQQAAGRSGRDSRLLVSFAGPAEQTDWQQKRLAELASHAGHTPEQVGSEIYQAVRDRPLSAEIKVAWRAAMVPRLAGGFAAAMVEELGSLLGLEGSAIVLPDSGSIWVGVTEGGDHERLAQLTSRWRAHAEAAGGRVVLSRAPLALKERALVWGSWGAQEKLLRRLKSKFDPTRLLSPGRFGQDL